MSNPYFEWDREKKDFKKPKLVVTRELERKNINLFKIDGKIIDTKN